MTHYGFDADRRVVVATWPAGVGNSAAVTATVPDAVDDETGQHLAAGLERLSASLWRTYTHPWLGDVSWVTEEGEEHDGPDQDAFAAVLPALREPHLPDASGLVLVSYDPVVEDAHQIGRLLHRCADPGLLEAVAADVTAELDAVERADLGDLDGRARQAVALSRADASPVQVQAAHAVLLREPLGSDELFVGIDPTAASVAAAHWLHAAAGLAAELSGRDPLGVIEEADDLEALPVLTPTLVLGRMIEGGESARIVVLDLVREALEAAEGRIPDLEGLVRQIAEAQQRAEQVAADRQDEIRDASLPDRVTPLDPSRPSIDLLEDLLAGVRACWLIYQEYSDLEIDDLDDLDGGDLELAGGPPRPGGGLADAPPAGGVDDPAGAGDTVNGAFDEARRTLRAEFHERLRAQADADPDRLL